MVTRSSDRQDLPIRGSEAGPRQRTDIQGLRAIAVASVLLYHLWPATVKGGYVGVDVFFVISGFLITGHLLRSPVRTGGDLLAFWARRVRRLLPAASVVLLVTLMASVIWLPSTVHRSVAQEVAAAALYVQNWVLAGSATDYLAAEGFQTPVQHHWSLSVEEQFYLVWPVLLGLLVWMSSRREQRSWIPAAGLAAVVASSLAWSAHLTATDPARAYFVSTTRFWELAAGGLLAAVGGRVVPVTAVRTRAVLAWAGLLAIIYAVATFDGATAFPGTAAAIPVLGTVLVLGTATDGLAHGPGSYLAIRPVVWLGDVSYATYLWHWPLIVIAPFALGRGLGGVGRVSVLVITLALAALTKVVVEDPIRRGSFAGRGLAPTFVLGAACMVVVATAAAGLHLKTQRDDRVARDTTMALIAADDADCFGAAAARNASCAFPGEDLLTQPAFAQYDRSVLYADGCWTNTPFTARRTCTYGADDPELRIALIGNSHAGHWQPALARIVAERDWSVTTYLVSECYTVDIAVDLGTAEATENCAAWNAWATDEVSGGAYDLVVISNRTNRDLVDVPRDQRGDVARDAYDRVLHALTRHGTPVLVLRDTPAAGRNVPECVAEHPERPIECATPTSSAIEQDPLAEAGSGHGSGLVHVADVNGLLCRDDLCHAVIGGVIVYFDHGHLSRTFAETLVDEIDVAVTRALALGER